jgi:hypothetical protein
LAAAATMGASVVVGVMPGRNTGGAAREAAEGVVEHHLAGDGAPQGGGEAAVVGAAGELRAR